MGLPNSREALPNGSGSIIPSTTILAMEDNLLALNRLLSGQAQGFLPTNVTLAGVLTVGGMTVTGASTQAAITASGLITANAGVQASHYNLPPTTIPIPAEAFQKTIGSPTLDGGSGSGLWTFQSGAANTIVYGLVLPVGTRITALKFHVNRASSSSGSITCSLNSKIVGGGNSNLGTPSGTYSDTLSSGGTYTTRDLIAIAGAPFTTVAGSAYWLEVDTSLNFTGAPPQFDGVEMTIDHT